jgi:hypothetical protein
LETQDWGKKTQLNTFILNWLEKLNYFQLHLSQLYLMHIWKSVGKKVPLI